MLFAWSLMKMRKSLDLSADGVVFLQYPTARHLASCAAFALQLLQPQNLRDFSHIMSIVCGYSRSHLHPHKHPEISPRMDLTAHVHNGFHTKMKRYISAGEWAALKVTPPVKMPVPSLVITNACSLFTKLPDSFFTLCHRI